MISNSTTLYRRVVESVIIWRLPYYNIIRRNILVSQRSSNSERPASTPRVLLRPHNKIDKSSYASTTSICFKNKSISLFLLQLLMFDEITTCPSRFRRRRPTRLNKRRWQRRVSTTRFPHRSILAYLYYYHYYYYYCVMTCGVHVREPIHTAAVRDGCRAETGSQIEPSMMRSRARRDRRFKTIIN